MPELPEVESARKVLATAALGRRIDDVDDSDTFECRPHSPGDIKAALVGRRLVEVHRRGKSLWCDTSGVGRSRVPGPVLGVHLGMSGRVVVTDRRGGVTEGGDYWQRGRRLDDLRFVRFSLTFADGGRFYLIDPRRLGRIRLEPAVELLGPDALEITLPELRMRLARGSAPVKARLLNQHVIAGVGNLLADELLWLARIDPARPVSELTTGEVTRLHRALRRAITSAIAQGGVHTGEVIAARVKGGVCPRCGAPMQQGVVGGRTTWWCSREQV
ncbi:MAG: DNA-formamidopyrimidine glycosylase family protein [bacterium]